MNVSLFQLSFVPRKFSRFLLTILAMPLLVLASASLLAAPVIIPAPPQLAASAYLLIDADTGKVLIEHNADQSLPPASLTKMMTSYIVSEEIDAGRLTESQLVRVSDDAWKRGGSASGSSTMFLEARSEVPVIDMLRGVIVQSGNDASIALAQHIAGGEKAFADIMNQQAQLLGMTSTHFVNATGWPAEGHVTTARDLARLARALINDHPDHYGIYSEKYFKHNGISQPNRNKLLFTDSSVDGLKTGHTDAAGYCLVASAKKQGMRLISVVMGARSESSRAAESQKLLSYGFRYYQTVKLYGAGDELSRVRVWGGDPKDVALTLADDIWVTIPRGSEGDVAAVTEIDLVVEAPVIKGKELGQLRVSQAEETLASANLIAAADVAQAGLVTRFMDWVQQKFAAE